MLNISGSELLLPNIVTKHSIKLLINSRGAALLDTPSKLAAREALIRNTSSQNTSIEVKGSISIPFPTSNLLMRTQNNIEIPSDLPRGIHIVRTHVNNIIPKILPLPVRTLSIDTGNKCWRSPLIVLNLQSNMLREIINHLASVSSLGKNPNRISNVRKKKSKLKTSREQKNFVSIDHRLKNGNIRNMMQFNETFNMRDC